MGMDRSSRPVSPNNHLLPVWQTDVSAIESRMSVCFGALHVLLTRREVVSFFFVFYLLITRP